MLPPTVGPAMKITGRPTDEVLVLQADGATPGSAINFSGFLNVGGGAVATLNNAPSAGDPTTWLPVLINGVPYAMPVWAL